MKRMTSLKASINTILAAILLIIFAVQAVYLFYITNLINVQNKKDIENTVYNISFYSKLKTNDSATVFRKVMLAAAYMENGEMQYKPIGESPMLDIASDKFTHVSFNYTFPSTESLKLYFYAQNELGAGTFYIDDFTITKVADTKLIPVSTPANNARNVPLNTKINLVFNNAINPASVTGKIKINGETTLVKEIGTCRPCCKPTGTDRNTLQGKSFVFQGKG